MQSLTIISQQPTTSSSSSYLAPVCWMVQLLNTSIKGAYLKNKNQIFHKIYQSFVVFMIKTQVLNTFLRILGGKISSLFEICVLSPYSTCIPSLINWWLPHLAMSRHLLCYTSLITKILLIIPRRKQRSQFFGLISIWSGSLKLLFSRKIWYPS